MLCAVVALGMYGCSSDGDSGASGSGGAGGTGGTAGAGGTGGDPGPSVPTEGLQAFLPFDGDAADQSGNGADGTLGGGATADGELLIGDNATDYLSLPSSVMDGLMDFTFAAWLRLDVVRDRDYEVISGANAAEDNAVLLWYRERADEWLFGVSSNESYAFEMDSTIEDGDWHHLVLIRSETTGLLYMDGQPVGDPVTVDDATLEVDPGGLIFGQDQDEVGGGFQVDQGWVGAMDNMRIYDRALDVSEVALLFAEPR
jgi:hypothetical protein